MPSPCPRCAGDLRHDVSGTLGETWTCLGCGVVWRRDPEHPAQLVASSRVRRDDLARLRASGPRTPQDAPRPRAAVSALTNPSRVRLPPVLTLGIDPGANTGLAVVGPSGLLWSATWRWKGLDSDPPGQFPNGLFLARAIGETLGKTRGSARGWASSWATSYRYAGRVDELVRRYLGTYPDLVEPGQWRASVGLPGNPPDSEILALARTIPGCFGDLSIHAAEAALIACYQE